jgi:CheY-like chemotaxis protein
VHPKLRLLCIDDEDIGLRVRKAVLERAGYEVLTAQTAQSGIELFTSGSFDCVILDFLMPGTNGGEIAATLRRIRPEVPILLLSAYVNLPEEVLQKVDAQVLKGAGPEQLLRQVRTMIENRRSNDGDPDGNYGPGSVPTPSR